MIRPDLSKLSAWGRERTPSWLCRTATALWLLLLTHAAMLGCSATKQSPTIDEPNHLAAGVSHWRTGSFFRDPGNPPLVKLVAAAPVMFFSPELPETSGTTGNYGRQFVVANGIRTLWLVTVGRWACIPFSLLGGYMCFRWARDLYGDRAGLLACLLWCFCPDVIAHGQLITADVPAAAIGVLTMYAFWKWFGEPTWGRTLLVGGLLGLSQLTRLILVIFYPLFACLWVAWRGRRTMPGVHPGTGIQALMLGTTCLVSVAVLNLGYGFEGSFRPFDQSQFGSRFLAGPRVDGSAGSAVREDASPTWIRMLSGVPIPLPAHYMTGVDQAKRWLEGGPRTFLAGLWKRGGWWYYYIYAMAVKFPLGTLVLLEFAAAASLLGIRSRVAWRDELILWLSIASIGVFVTCVTLRSAQYFRYLLPMFPFCFIVASRLVQTGAWLGRGTGGLVIGAALWSAVSSLWVYPHSGSYFNELAGGPMTGHQHLQGASSDWGQDLLYLKEFLDEHPEVRPLRLAYFGSIDPAVVGIPFPLIR